MKKRFPSLNPEQPELDDDMHPADYRPLRMRVAPLWHVMTPRERARRLLEWFAVAVVWAASWVAIFFVFRVLTRAILRFFHP